MSDQHAESVFQALIIGVSFAIAGLSGLLAIIVRPPVDGPAWMANPQALWGWLLGAGTAFALWQGAEYLEQRLRVQECSADE